MASGTCKFCGCTERKACVMPFGACHWINAERTICSNPRCLAKVQLSKQAPSPHDECVSEVAKTLLAVNEARGQYQKRLQDYYQAQANLYACEGREYVPPEIVEV